MIRSERAHLQVAASTHPGMSGKNNEDRFAVSAYYLSKAHPIPVLLAVLCDGIGGHRAGEVAAELAVDTISHVVAESSADRPQDTIQLAIHEASQRIFARSQEDADQHGMGATCACAWIINNRLYSATVGDSRIYLLRNGAIQQLSTDHTWIQEAIERGILTQETAKGHPNAHVIRRYLGSPSLPEVDFRIRLHPEDSDELALANQGTVLQPNDTLLLCSDGLTDLVEDQEIMTILQEKPQEEAVQALIDLANERGGHDNITIVTLRMPPKLARQPALSWVGANRRWVIAGCLGIILVAALTVAALFSLDVFKLDLTEHTPTPANVLTLPASHPVDVTLAVPQPTTTHSASATVAIPPAPTETQTPAPSPTFSPTHTPNPAP